jgi:curli biogenesis system outer membrane secretion channel CsgG
MSRHIVSIILAALTLTTSACITHMTGEAKDDSTLSGETQQLESAGAAYTGPQYTIGIVQFDNKAPAKVTGVGEAAATILRTQLETAGLKTILLDENALKEADKFIALQRSGVIKTGGKYADSGFDALDYRLSGSITAYSEVEEGIDAVVFQKKSVVARVTVDYALVDIATGKPLVAESGAGEYRKTTTGALGLGAKSSFDPNLRDGALRDALAKATEKVIRKLSAMPFQGKLLAIDSQSVAIKAGTRSQLKEGVQLAVYHVGETLRDPDNGQILGYKENKIGVIKINRHQNENISEATIVSGSGFQVGDIVRPLP